MARIRPADVMDRLLAAGTDVFASKGLARARMSDVADAMGVAHGTVYTYVESKEALFALLVERGADTEPMPIPEELPVPAPPEDELLERLQSRIEEVFALPALDRALSADGAGVRDPRGELAEIVGELYDRTYDTRRQASVLERSAWDLPDLFRVFYAGVRHRLFARLAEYLSALQSAGSIRPEIDPDIAARHVAEAVTYFGRHRFGDPDPLGAEVTQVRANAIDLLCTALLGGERREGE